MYFIIYKVNIIVKVLFHYFLERMASLLPSDKRNLPVSVLPRREPFEILYRLNCDNLCADFHEDLQFRFSWGITALISRFVGKGSGKLALNNYPQRVCILKGVLKLPSEYLIILATKFLCFMTNLSGIVLIVLFGVIYNDKSHLK